MDAGAPLDLRLLPRSAAVDGDGRLRIAGIDVADLAARFGTPLYVYDEGELRVRCRAYRDAFGDLDGKHAGAAYAGKAFLCPRWRSSWPRRGWTSTSQRAGRRTSRSTAGFPPERILFHGNNKSELELRFALALPVGRIVVDGFDEIDRIEGLVADGLPPPQVLLRVTPGVEAHTHAYIATGSVDSKFGFTVSNGAARDAAIRAVEERGDGPRRLPLPHRVADPRPRCLHEGGRSTGRRSPPRLPMPPVRAIEELNLGGGLGVAYTADDLVDLPSIPDFAAVVRSAHAEACAAAGLDHVPRLTVEAGRSIAGPAGLTLYTVGTVKTIPGVRTYVAVDGGMSDNPRPATYGARYEAFVPARAASERSLTATVAGKHCEQGDLLVRDASLPDDIAVGDVLATPVTGAYAHAMASNYNLVPRPAVVFVGDDGARLVVRRETLEDLVSRDVVDPGKTEA